MTRISGAHWGKWMAALVVSWAAVATVDHFTNSCKSDEFTNLYLTIGQHGLIDNPQLVAPVAYRFLPPLVGGGIARLTGISVAAAFRWETYLASMATLLLAYGLARRLGANFWAGVFTAATLVLSLGEIKNNLFFNLPMEAVGHALMLAWCWLLLDRRHYWSLVCICLGMCTREFFLIPAAVSTARLTLGAWQSRQREDWVRAAVVAGMSLAAFVLPRLLIHVSGTIQLIDPLNDGGWLTTLLDTPQDMKRNINVLLAIVGYMLPTWMLLTTTRVASLRQRLGGQSVWLGVYVAVFLPLMFYGGTDFYRYATYLIVPQIVLLALLLQDRRQPVRLLEIVLVLVAMVIHNKLFLRIPDLATDPDRYLKFWPGLGNNLSWPIVRRTYQVICFVAPAVTIRCLTPIISRIRITILPAPDYGDLQQESFRIATPIFR